MLRNLVFLLSICLIAFSLFAEEQPAETGEIQRLFSIHGEVKAHYRWAEDTRFLLRFPFPPEFIPRGQTQVFEQVVDPGSSFEVSNAAVIVDFVPSESIVGKVKIHFIDLYNRNPTSTDQTVNVKEAWLLFGKRTEFLQVPEGTGVYVMFGKAPKFERQPDRNLESYGLLQTALNRFEDLQLQFGGNFGEHIYWRAQVSNGNPVFFRDTNALAGDNGNDDLRFPNPELHLNSGYPILYDAEVEELSFHKPEVGGGLGIRFQSVTLEKGLDLLGFYYQRELADRVDLRGTFYGGDLDLLDGTGGISLPIQGNDKIEYGANANFRWGGFRVFFQGAVQEMAELKRNGIEVEVLFRFSLPATFAAGGRQLFTFLQPVFRYSNLDNDFGPVPQFVAPSVFWDWEKMDLGFRLGIIQGVDLTFEYSEHDITTTVPLEADEFLTTLRFRF